MDNFVKILFAFHSNVLDEWTIETMWAETINIDKGYYQIDNIPFYAPVACGDIIYAEYDEDEKRLVYRETITPSGNSTIQVIVYKAGNMDEIRGLFNSLGCESEKFNDGYFVIDVPASLDYTPVKERLEQLSAQSLLDYAEPCLGESHGNY